MLLLGQNVSFFLHKNIIMRRSNKDSIGVKWNMTIQLLCVVQWNNR
jgi:hypothetical protein